MREPLHSALYCHCKRCQRRTGSAFAIGGFAPPGSFDVTEGEDLLRSWLPQGGSEKFFCGECGGHLFTINPKTPELVNVRFGALDQDPEIRPEAHQFSGSAPAWAPLPDDGLPRFQGRRPPEAV